MATKLSPEQIQEQLHQVPGWELAGDEIKRRFSFADFIKAMEFVNQVADLAEAADHHPDILIQYKHVTLTLSTHSAGGLTSNDFELAQSLNNLVGQWQK